MSRDLTNEELRRQDLVDNLIHSMLLGLASGREVTWDIDFIGHVRDAVAHEFESRGVMSAQEFYPSIAPEPAETPVEPADLNSAFELVLVTRNCVKMHLPDQFSALVTSYDGYLSVLFTGLYGKKLRVEEPAGNVVNLRYQGRNHAKAEKKAPEGT